MPSHRSSPTRTRRRSLAADPLVKVTFQIRASVMELVRNAVNDGAAPSLNAFMERAAELHLRELRRDVVFDSYGEAAQDPEFKRDLQDVTREFNPTASDGLGS